MISTCIARDVTRSNIYAAVAVLVVGAVLLDLSTRRGSLSALLARPRPAP